jgi:uncharacterized protein
MPGRVVPGQEAASVASERAGGLFRGRAGYVARTPWGPLPAFVAAVAIVLASIAVPWLLVDLARATLGRPLVAAQWADLASRVLVILLTLAASMLLGGRARDVLALGTPARGWRSYAGAVLMMYGVPTLLVIVGLALAALLGALDWLTQAMMEDHHPPQPARWGWEGDWLWAFALLVVVIAPVEEELLFRGFLQSALAKSRLGFWGAAVVTTGLWMALHEYSIAGLAKVFVLGLVFSWLLWRTGSLRVTIFGHALNNLVALVLLQYLDYR